MLKVSTTLYSNKEVTIIKNNISRPGNRYSSAHTVGGVSAPYITNLQAGFISSFIQRNNKISVLTVKLILIVKTKTLPSELLSHFTFHIQKFGKTENVLLATNLGVCLFVCKMVCQICIVGNF